jgi:hypothetical protein
MAAATPAPKPPEPESLAAALARLQSDMPRVAKGETARVKSDRTGSEYTYTYADLEDCAQALYPKMGPLGLSFTAQPTINEHGHFVLAYQLRHVSGQSIEGVYPLPDPGRGKPQEMGSAITYARRYTLCAVTGLTPGGDDDDAAAAQHAAQEQTQRNRNQNNQSQNGNGRQQQAASQQQPGPPLSAAEVAKLEDEYMERMRAAATPRALAAIASEAAGDSRLAGSKGRLQPVFTDLMTKLTEEGASQ